jgi:tetratricopeptide (TPR) repeat protein/serine/threonine protein kinase
MIPSVTEVHGRESMDSAFAELVEQLTARYQAGEKPDHEKVLREHPEHAERLRPLLPALQLLADLSQSGPRSPLAGLLDAPAGAETGLGARGAGTELGTLGDFRLWREVGRGGMAVVYEAEQISLKRRVALKVLPFAATMDSRRLQRFRNEALAAASLDHPHIVKVHAVGQERAVHFYAMQFIDGITLADFIAEQKGASAPRTGRPSAAPDAFLSMDDRNQQDPRAKGDAAMAKASEQKADNPLRTGGLPPLSTDALRAGKSTDAAGQRTEKSDIRHSDYFRNVARLGVEAAEALEHAHVLGIVHRDVKPGNLMLDGEGKLWVTDFGLARTAGDAGLTRPGDVLGTLRYMSPEQALARHGLVDHRTDIYALGATLYELLTLQPPVDGEDSRQILHRIEFEEPIEPRKLNRAIPTDLETVVLKAMSKEPDRRYKSAQELADDLGRYLKDEHIQARRPGLYQRGAKWVRRHRFAATAAVVALLLLLMGGGAAAWWARHYQAEAERRQEKQEQAIVGALEQVRQLRQALHSKLARPGGVFQLLNKPGEWQAQIQAARIAWQRAQEFQEGAEGAAAAKWREEIQSLDEGLQKDEAERTLAVSLEKVRLDRSVIVDDKLNRADALKGYPEAFRPVGLSLKPRQEAADADRIRRFWIKEQLVASLDDWALVAWLEGQMDLHKQLLQLARRADPDPWKDQVRTPGFCKDPAAVQKLADGLLADRAALARLSPHLLDLIGGVLEVTGGDAERWRRQVQLLYPSDFWLSLNLAILLSNANPGEAAGHYRAALAARVQCTTAWINLGNALYRLGNHAGAISHYQKALQLAPKYAEAHYNLGIVLYSEKDYAAAIRRFQQALKLDPKHARAHNNWGIVLHAQKDFAGAIRHYREALKLDPKLAAAHCNWGLTLVDQQDYAGAINHFQEALKLDANLAEAHLDWGVALRAQKDHSGAISHFQEALKLDARLGLAHHHLAHILLAQKDYVGAMRHCAKAVELDPQLAGAHVTWGNALYEQLEYHGAIGHFQQALKLDPKDAKAHICYGNALAAIHDHDRAIRHYQEADQLDANFGQVHYAWGLALAAKKDYAGAISHYRKMLERDPNHAMAHCALADALCLQGHFPAALKEMRIGDQLGSKQPNWTYPSAYWVQQCEKMLALDQKLEAVLAGQIPPPGTIAEQLECASFCRKYHKYRAATIFFTNAFSKEPTLLTRPGGPHRYTAACCAALAASGQGNDATNLGEADKSKLRQQVLAWLKDELAAQVKALDRPLAATVVLQTLKHWQKDENLAGLRDARQLARLPEAQRQEWQQFWAEVDALLKKVQKLP